MLLYGVTQNLHYGLLHFSVAKENYANNKLLNN